MKCKFFNILINVNDNCITFQISVTAALRNDIEQFLIHFLIISVIFLYLFLLNYIAQEITDHNNHVFSTV